MKHIFYPLLTAAILALSAFTALQPGDWKIAEPYAITFTSEDPSGSFTQFSGDIAFDTAHLGAARFDVAVEAASINTGNGMKNKHARSDEWLDTEKYPKIRFVSNRFAKKDDHYVVTGTLDLHGIKKEIAIPFTFVNQTFAGDFTVNRVDYNIGKTTGIYGKVSKELKIRFSVPVTAK